MRYYSQHRRALAVAYFRIHCRSQIRDALHITTINVNDYLILSVLHSFLFCFQQVQRIFVEREDYLPSLLIRHFNRNTLQPVVGRKGFIIWSIFKLLSGSAGLTFHYLKLCSIVDFSYTCEPPGTIRYSNRRQGLRCSPVLC